MANSISAKKFYSRVFETSHVTTDGALSKSRWLIMQLDTFIDPYDWIAISRDFRFSQEPFVRERNEENVIESIRKYIETHEPYYGRNMYIDSNGEPWALSAGISGYSAFGVTGAYDGMYVEASQVDGGVNQVQYIENAISKLVKEGAIKAIDPPATLEGYTKEDGQNQDVDPFFKKAEKLTPKEATKEITGATPKAEADKTVSPWELPSPTDMTSFKPPAPKPAITGQTLMLLGAVGLAGYFLYKNQK